VGDDFYFGISMYFPSAYFDHWTCDSSTPLPTTGFHCDQCAQPSQCFFDQLVNSEHCPSGVPDGSDAPGGAYSAWNVVTQWHAPGFPNMGFDLQRLYESGTQQYQLKFSSMPQDPSLPPLSGHQGGGLWHDAGDPSKGGALWTDKWYHFVVHFHFGATPYAGGTPLSDNGFVELWESIDDVPGQTNLTQQAFNGVHNDSTGASGAYLSPACYSGSSSTLCYTDTMDPNDTSGVSLKQGHYRNPTLTDLPPGSCPLPLDNGICPTVMFYKDTAAGTQFGDVAPTPRCDSISCATGCCDGSNHCITPPTDLACGTAGASCVQCGAGLTCQGGSCQFPPCGPNNCGGCCDSSGGCHTQSNGFCGIRGSACQDCTSQGDICLEVDTCTGDWACSDPTCRAGHCYPICP
jgi:hypothetical protein